MTVLELCFRIDKVKDMSDYHKYYDFWTIDREGMFLMLSYRNKPEFFQDIERVTALDIESSIEGHIHYIWENTGMEQPYFIPYEELETYTKVEVEIDSNVFYDKEEKYPLVCVRGTCDKQCSGKKIDAYCFREIPCTDHRPDWNVWSQNYPNFYNLLFDAVHFIDACPHTDTFVVMFEYTPYLHEQELNFHYIYAALLIRNHKITVIGDSAKAKKLYEKYNKKFPTKDREIETSISQPEEGFYFHF